MSRTWKDDAFWSNPDHTQITGIVTIEEEDGVSSSRVMNVTAGPDGTNPDWLEVIEQLGRDKIDQNTKEREERKTKERQAHELALAEREKARKLEKLFNAKLAAFEVEEIKNSTNRQLKARLRRAKSITEVNVYAMMIVMEAIENEDKAE